LLCVVSGVACNPCGDGYETRLSDVHGVRIKNPCCLCENNSRSHTINLYFNAYVFLAVVFIDFVFSRRLQILILLYRLN